jgi:hypothetical protein
LGCQGGKIHWGSIVSPGNNDIFLQLDAPKVEHACDAAGVCLGRPVRKTLIGQTLSVAGTKNDMKLRMTKKLKFWVDVACEQGKAGTATESRRALTRKILREFEQAGDAMRYLRADGKIGWKATPQMLDRLADAEREAVEDAEHDLP